LAVMAMVLFCADAASGQLSQVVDGSCLGPSGVDGGSCSGTKFGTETILLMKSSALSRAEAGLQVDSAAKSLWDFVPDRRSDQRVYEKQLRLIAQDRVTKAQSGVGESGSGSVAEATAKILTIIEDEVMQDIRRARNEHQDEVLRHIGYIGECKQSDLDQYIEVIDHGVKQSQEAEMTHTTCRSLQQVVKGVAEEACRETHQWLSKELSDFGCLLGGSMAPADLQAHIDCVADFASDLDEARVLHSGCDNTSKAYHAKIEECEHRENEHHDLHCGVEAQMRTQCTNYNLCYKRESGRYTDVKVKVKEAEGARSHQVVAVERIKCYLNEILGADFTVLASEGGARMAACSTLVGNSSALYAIDYPEPPLLETCPWKTWLDTEDVDCVMSTTLATAVATTATTTSSSSTTTRAPTTTTTTPDGPPVSCNRYKNEEGLSGGAHLNERITAADLATDFELKVLVKVTKPLAEQGWGGILGGSCGTMGLWLTRKGLRNERQCGPHHGDSLTQPSNFEVGGMYWITIKRVGNQGTMTVNHMSASAGFADEVSTVSYNINYDYYNGIETVGQGHDGSEFFGGLTYCVHFEK